MPVEAALLEDYRTVPRDAMYLVYAGFLPSLAFGMFQIDACYFLTTVQGLPDVLMGTIIMSMGVTTVLTSIPLGIAADRYGRKKALIFGNILASCTIAMFALTTNPFLLLLCAITGGVSQASFNAAGNALLAEKAGNANRTSAFSLNSFVSSSAHGLGGFMIPLTFILEASGLPGRNAHIALYVALGALSLLSTPLILKVTETTRLSRPYRKRGIPSRKTIKILAKFLLSSSIVAFGAGMVVPLMTRWLYLKYGTPDTVSGPILGTSSFLIAFAVLTVPALARRLGVVKAIVFTQGASTLFMFATPLSPNYLVASMVYVVRAFLMNMSNPLQQSLIMGLVAEDERGAASGINAALWTLPNSMSTSIGAALMGAGMLEAPFYLATLLYCISIGIFWVVFGNMKILK